MISLQRARKVYFNVRFEGPINQFGQGLYRGGWVFSLSKASGRLPSPTILPIHTLDQKADNTKIAKTEPFAFVPC